MLMFCDPTDCYGLYCLERGFWMGRSLHGDAQQKQSQGPDGPVHFQLRSDTWHIPGGKGIPELYYTFLQHHSGNLWQGCIKTWGCDPSTCHLPQESRHLGATGHCCAHSLRAQAETLNFQIHFSKIPFCMSAMWLWFWKMAPQNSKAGTLCSGTWQSLMNNFFFLPSCSHYTTQWAELYCWLPQLMPAFQEGTVPAHVVIFPLKLHCTKQMGSYMTDLMLSIILCNNKFKLHTLTLPQT